VIHVTNAVARMVEAVMLHHEHQHRHDGTVHRADGRRDLAP
jgi:hypothetical protein